MKQDYNPRILEPSGDTPINSGFMFASKNIDSIPKPRIVEPSNCRILKPTRNDISKILK